MHFNYIVPVYNKEDVLPATLEGIDECASPESEIFIIIDGCTDKSEQITDKFANRTKRNVKKIHMPNVHMLRSVNAALRVVRPGFTVVMQDDIVLKDRQLEPKIVELYSRMGPRLGVVSLRLASNLTTTPLLERVRMGGVAQMIKETDYLQSNDDNQSHPTVDYEQFIPRLSAINGPNIIPWTVREKVGIFDENLAPYGYDDPEYCIRAVKNGFINGIFPLRYLSDEDWGGTRRSKQFKSEVRKIHCRNRTYIWKLHGTYLNWLSKTGKIYRSDKPVKSLEELPQTISGS